MTKMEGISEVIKEFWAIHEQNQRYANQAAENVANSTTTMARIFRGKIPQQVETHMLDMVTHYKEQVQATIMQSEGFTKVAVMNCEQTQLILTLQLQVAELERLIRASK